MVSYPQQCSAYYGYIRTHPGILKTQVHNHFAGGTFGMQKKHSLDLAENLIKTDKYRVKMNASQAPKATKAKANKGIYRRAIQTTRKYEKEHPLSSGKERSTVDEVTDNTFGSGDKPDDFAERYDENELGI